MHTLNILESSKALSFVIFYSNVYFFVYLTEHEIFMHLYCFVKGKAIFKSLCPFGLSF